MNTTASIVAELSTELDGHIAAGRFTDEKDCRQQINAHETLARLRAEYDSNPSDALAGHIGFWVRMVVRDVDPPEPVKKPKGSPAVKADEPE